MQMPKEYRREEFAFLPDSAGTFQQAAFLVPPQSLPGICCQPTSDHFDQAEQNRTRSIGYLRRGNPEMSLVDPLVMTNLFSQLRQSSTCLSSPLTRTTEGRGYSWLPSYTYHSVMCNPSVESGQQSVAERDTFSWMHPYKFSEWIHPIAESGVELLPNCFKTQFPTRRVVGDFSGPYLNPDGSFKSDEWYKETAREELVAIYAIMEKVHKIKLGRHLGSKRNIYLSMMERFVLKKKKYNKRNLDSWKQLPICKNIMQLLGILTADSSSIYEVTHRMDCNLGEARKNKTLIDLAYSHRNDRWANIISKYSHIIRSILLGTIHLNDNGYQHYDLKEDNIFVKKPHGCLCHNILECTCRSKWEVKIGDFDTLWPIKRPDKWERCGTLYYRPPEAEGGPYYDIQYKGPTYDSWSITVIFLHFCCGPAWRTINKVISQSPWLKREVYYAHHLLKELSMASINNPRLAPLKEFATYCLEESHVNRPTPLEMLKMWDQIMRI